MIVFEIHWAFSVENISNKWDLWLTETHLLPHSSHLLEMISTENAQWILLFFWQIQENTRPGNDMAFTLCELEAGLAQSK